MNQDTEASSSSSSSTHGHLDSISKLALASLHVNSIVDECKKLREQVESVQNLNTLIFYSRLIHAAVESIKAMINEWNTMFPNWEDDQTKAFDYCCKKACDVYKGIRTMFSSSILTSSTTNKTGDSKKVQMWKKQCDKNIDRIVSLIKNAILKEYSTWFDKFRISGIYHGTYGVLSSLYQILQLKESANDAQLKIIAELVLESMEVNYKNHIKEQRERVIETVVEDVLEKLTLKNLEKEEEALEKLQEDDTVKRFQEEATLKQKNLQEEESQKNSQEGEINKKLQQAEAHKKFQEDEPLKKLKER